MKRLGLWLAVLAHLVFAGWHAEQTPVFEFPDENGHFTYAWHLLQHGEQPIVKDSAALAERPGWRQSDLGHHPPLYYHVLAAALRAQDCGDLSPTMRSAPTGAEPAFHFVHGWDEVGERSGEVRAFHRLRWISILCGAVSLVLVHGLLRRALPECPFAADLAVLGLALNPGWSLPHASLDNGALAVALMLGSLTACASAVQRERLSLPLALVGGGLGGLALMTKLTAVGTVPLFGLAVLWILWRRPDRRRETVGAALMGGSVLLALWTPFVLRNLELYGEPLATAVHQAAFAVSVVPDELWNTHVSYALPVLVFRSATGVVGWNLGYAPEWIRWAVALVLLAGLFGSAIAGRRIGLRWPVAVLLLASTAVALALLVRFNLVFHQPQARYALGGVAGLALPVAGGWAALQRWNGRAARAAAAALVAAALAAAIHAAVDAGGRLAFEPGEVDPRYAILTRGLTTEPPAPALQLERVGDSLPPTVTWDPPLDGVSLHLWCLDGPPVGGSFEHLDQLFGGGRLTVPQAVWDSLPEGFDVGLKLREPLDRRIAGAPSAPRESAALVVRRP